MNKQEIEKAISYIQNMDLSSFTDKDDACRVVDMLTEHLQQQLTSGWIPVTDRLPEIRKHESGEPIEFNIMLQRGRVPTTGCINDEGIWGWMNWNSFKFNPIGVNVIAWQPPPEPYREERADT